jgi:phosphoglycerate kinase
MVGFTETLNSFAGPIMQKEMESCSKIREEFDTGVLVLGGEKPSDLVGIIDEMIESVDKVLLGGIPGELALMAEGENLGEKSNWIEEKGLDSKKSEFLDMIEKHREKFELPEDVVSESGNYDREQVPEGMTWDIGEKTREKFTESIRSADAVMMKGPLGAFEDHPEGTKQIVDAIAENNGFTVLGGGHTSSLVQRFGYGFEDFSHVSIAGGAFVRFMSGEELPAIEALRK